MVTAPKPVHFLDATCTNSIIGVFKSNGVLLPRESLDPGECNISHTLLESHNPMTDPGTCVWLLHRPEGVETEVW